MKIYSAKYAPIVLANMQKMVCIYEANSKSVSIKRSQLVQQFATITEFVLKGGFAAYCVGGTVYLLNPIYSYFWKNRVVPMLPLYMPLVDENTKAGFITLSVLHMSLTILTVIASAALDFLLVMIIVNTPLLSTISGDNVRELNDILNEKNVNLPLANAKLKNIFLIHFETFEYVLYFFIT